MTKKPSVINKVSDKLSKVNDSFSVYMYDNGFMVEISGRSGEGDYTTAKMLEPTLEGVFARLTEAVELPRDN